MVGSTGGCCPCGVLRARFSSAKDVCAADGFDHHEELCCNCLVKQLNWRYYEDDACDQCRRRQRALETFGATLTTRCGAALGRTELLRIDADAAKVFANSLDISEVKVTAGAPCAPEEEERTAALLLAWNAINYSYYTDSPSPRWRWQAADGAVVGADDEANGVVAALAQLNAGSTQLGLPPLADASFLCTVDVSAIRETIFKAAPGAGELPLAEQRASALRELGEGLARLGITPLGLVRAAKSSAAALIATLVREFPSYADVQRLPGADDSAPLEFHKRAQLVCSMLHGARVGGGFRDIEALTVFADYRLPQLLRVVDVGILHLAPALAARIDAGEPIVRDSAEEVLLRAATVWGATAVGDALRARAGAADITQAQLDYYLWRTAVRRDAAGELPAFHKTRCTAY